MLTISCRPEFLSGDRERGELLSRQNRVELTVVGQDGAMAIVEGSAGDDYIVGVDFRKVRNKQLGMHCDCPRFEDGYHCKHLWAVFKKLDSEYEILSSGIRTLAFFEIDVTTLDVGSKREKRRSPPTPVLSNKDRILELIRRRRDAKSHAPTNRPQPQAVPTKPTSSTWKQTLHKIGIQATQSAVVNSASQIPTEAFGDAVWRQQHWFVLSLANETNQRVLQLDVMRSTRKTDGQWSKPTPCVVATRQVRTAVDANERAAFSVLLQATNPYSSYSRDSESGTFGVNADLLEESLRVLHATGRFAWKLGDSRFFEDARVFRSVSVDGTPWRMRLALSPHPDKGSQLILAAQLQRDDESIPLTRLMLASDAGYAIVQHETSRPTLDVKMVRDSDRSERVSDERVSDERATSEQTPDTIDASIIKIDPASAAGLRAWQQTGQLTVPNRSLNTLFAELAQSHSHVDIAIDPALEVIQATAISCGRCLLHQQQSKSGTFDASLFVRYQDCDLSFDDPTLWWWDAAQKRLTRRSDVSERALLATIPIDAFRVDDLASYGYGLPSTPQPSLAVPRERFIEVVETLRGAKWEVLAEGSPIRIATDFNISVSSGTDWFDLSGEADFDGITASLPQLLAALRSGNHTFVLDDGTLGMLPEAWLKKFAGMQASGEITEDGIRFSRTQALLLDAMLGEQDNVRRDRSFTEFCDKLKSFTGIAPADPPDTFVGELRPYQQLGLGWFEFLREFRFGGCLADDMGLGKTIQVLSLLEDRRTRKLKKKETRKPSLAVVPKSLIFNWIDEARKFTPDLHVLNYTGTDRTERLAEAMQDSASPLDLILTTYGTLRRDAAELRETEFDYVILDEAQAIKNPQSQAAKASRLLRGEHRLAMTGTPVENHLGDLWSLFDFLNPGMLGAAPRMAQLPDDEDRQRITHVSQSLRPFILRRTKAQVLTELPEKVEQTLACEMEPKQRKLYAQLKEHYRLHLSKKVEELGLKRSKIHVLEALLRLRQAACDPRLINPDCGVTGAKIIHLMEQLEEVIGEGHKVLVFSQFTKLLALVRQEIDAREWPYEYLDGKTNNRSEHVKRFQEDDDCKLFLISLKAGGNGLNLTAADYVFILDPWWNPAVEAQAIDRAHRMGQSKSVMAYRMICEDTVESKIIALQQSKRDLADAIINQDKSLISNLTADDLQQLLS